MDIKHRPRRSGRGGAVAVELQPGAVVLEDGTQLRRAVTLPIHFPRFRLASTTHTGLESMFMVHLTPGRHTATTQVRLRAGPASQWRVEWFGAGAARGKEGDQIPGDAEMLAVWTFPLQATFEVVPDGQEIIERVNDPALANTIRDNIKIDRCTITQPQAGPTVLDCVLQVRDVPINLAFEVSFRVAGREWAVTDVSYESALGNSHMGPDFSRIRGTNRTIPMPRYDLTKPPVHDFPPEVQSVDIVLRTSTRLAENGALMRIWDGEIVIEDVPLHHVVPGGWKHRRSDGRLDGV